LWPSLRQGTIRGKRRTKGFRFQKKTGRNKIAREERKKRDGRFSQGHSVKKPKERGNAKKKKKKGTMGNTGVSSRELIPKGTQEKIWGESKRDAGLARSEQDRCSPTVKNEVTCDRGRKRVKRRGAAQGKGGQREGGRGWKELMKKGGKL